MEVTYTAPSSYTISIPASITVGENAKVEASNVVLHEGETLSVSVSSKQYANNSWQLVDGGNSIPYTIENTQTGEAFFNNDTALTAKNGENPSVILSTAMTGTAEYAGDYKDTLVFAVKLTSQPPAAEEVSVDLSTLNETYVIKDSGTYKFTGTGSYGIKVVSGDPTIKLDNAAINITEDYKNGIDVTGSDATIHVTGNSTVQAKRGAGIHVAEGYTVTITGNSREDKLTAKSTNDGAGIGGYVDSAYHDVACGNITITNVHVEAHGGSASVTGGYSTGIGGSGAASCGTITINDATVYAYPANTGDYSSAAIGAGFDSITISLIGSFERITIENNSTVYVQKAPYGDYIGYGGCETDPASGQLIGDTDKIRCDTSSTVTPLN